MIHELSFISWRKILSLQTIYKIYKSLSKVLEIKHNIHWILEGLWACFWMLTQIVTAMYNMFASLPESLGFAEFNSYVIYYHSPV